MTLKKLQTIQNVLDKMSKPEMVLLAREYNQFVKIPNLHKMKKNDIKIELLSNYEIVHDIWSGKEPVTLKKSKKKEFKKLGNDELNKMIQEQINLTELSIKSNDPAEKAKLFKESEKIGRKIKRSM